MIQRIQTVYLLLVAGLFIALFFLPLVAFIQSDFDIIITITNQNPVLVLIAGLITGGSTGIIFLYKNRKRQKKYCWILALFIMGFIALFGYYLWSYIQKTELSSATIKLYAGTIFPFIALVLNFLAINRISADEKLIRSLDRIR
jgi:uncharacterized membrane protein